MNNSNIPVSFEFFPTKTNAGHEKLIAAAHVLAEQKPEFFSVTYGAGGSTRDRTQNTVLQLDQQVKVPTAPHLSCVGDSKEDLRQLLNEYREAGIHRIVALRGDLPSGMGRPRVNCVTPTSWWNSSARKPVITSPSRWLPIPNPTPRPAISKWTWKTSCAR